MAYSTPYNHLIDIEHDPRPTRRVCPIPVRSKHIAGAAWEAAKERTENSTRTFNSQLPPTGIEANYRSNSMPLVHDNRAQNAHHHIREHSAHKIAPSRQKKSTVGCGVSIPRAARFPPEPTRERIPAVARTTHKHENNCVTRSYSARPPLNRRDSTYCESNVKNIQPVLRKPSGLTPEFTPPTVHDQPKPPKTCNSATAIKIFEGGTSNSATVAIQQPQKAVDLRKPTPTAATIAPRAGTIPVVLVEDQSAPLCLVFLSLKRVWHNIWLNLERGQDQDILSLRFTCWGKRYFSYIFREVDPEEEEAVMRILTYVFSSIAEYLVEFMKQIGMEPEGTDWDVVNAFLEEVRHAEEEEVENGDSGEVVLEAGDQESEGGLKWKELDGGSDNDGDDDDDDDDEEEEEEEEEEGLKPLFTKLKGLVDMLEGLSSTLVLGRFSRY